jgi:hypothetical protein
VWGHAILFHRSLLKHLLPIPEAIPHDIWTAFVAASNKGIQHLDESLVFYRQHNKTVTTTLPPDKIERRNLNKKAEEYLDKLYWLDVMKEFEGNRQTEFFGQLYLLYRQKEKGFSFALFRFLVQHRKALFQFTKKSFISQVNECRKQARGVTVKRP